MGGAISICKGQRRSEDMEQLPTSKALAHRVRMCVLIGLIDRLLSGGVLLRLWRCVRLAVSSAEEWSGEEEKVQGKGEVPFCSRGRVRHLRPRQTFRLVTAGAKVSVRGIKVFMAPAGRR